MTHVRDCLGSAPLAQHPIALDIDSALTLLMEAGEPFDYATVKELANPAPPRAPVLSLSGMPDLRVYDSLLVLQRRINWRGDSCE